MQGTQRSNARFIIAGGRKGPPPFSAGTTPAKVTDFPLRSPRAGVNSKLSKRFQLDESQHFWWVMTNQKHKMCAINERFEREGPDLDFRGRQTAPLRS